MLPPVFLRNLCGLLALCVASAAFAGPAPEETIVYPAAEAPGDERNNYPLQLLRLALAKAKYRATLQVAPTLMSQSRTISELADNTGRLSILWVMTTPEREKRLRPIRIPIDKGLLGWRIALVRADRYDLFRKVDSLAALSKFTAGLEYDWPDVTFLKSAGLPVEPASNYQSMFKMLARNRFDYSPRSVVEIWAEVEKHRALGLIVEPRLALHYQTALYFFVAKQNAALAEAIERGLEIAIRDGSFDRLFYTHFAKAIEQADFSRRKVLSIGAQDAFSQLPLDRKEFWFRPPGASEEDAKAR